MRLRFMLPWLMTAFAFAQQESSDRQRIKELENQVAALRVQVQKLEAALQRTPQALNVPVQLQLDTLMAQRDAILRQRSEFLKVLKPTHPDVVFLNKRLAAVEELLSAELLKPARP